MSLFGRWTLLLIGSLNMALNGIAFGKTWKSTEYQDEVCHLLLPYFASVIRVNFLVHLIEAVFCEIRHLQEVLKKTLSLSFGERPRPLPLCTRRCIVAPNLTHDLYGGVEDAVSFLDLDFRFFANSQLELARGRQPSSSWRFYPLHFTSLLTMISFADILNYIGIYVRSHYSLLQFLL